ncbi:hypothetical protein GOODEAATRI_005000 [Goodea atripinnis]|uniref:Clathrin/coatomer adaptor adaptin-like N-terminal domain-containing protein n=1 Tax=Goodea atripinnis TaxID=208336 RepID=A0ABV0P1T9_9TELE
MAFEEVCPDRIDLIHKNYRKLCNLLVDVEEWGQVVIINMLTRYARTQFTSPWKEVVMAVAQLYWHLAPKHEVSIFTKSLVRLLRSHSTHNAVAYLHRLGEKMKSCFVSLFHVPIDLLRKSVSLLTLQLEILTNLANEANISTILREFQTYVKSQDKAFAAATIQAIGRCATNISEVTDTCLNGLVLLLSNRDETVVAESVVVIKKLLQTQPTQHSDIIKHMAKLFDNITVCFILVTTKLLTQYILNLGKYDQNYDIRDRTRFVRQLIVPNEKSGALNKYARRILLAPKPAPVLESAFKGTSSVYFNL